MPWKLAVFGFAVLVGVCCGVEAPEDIKLQKLIFIKNTDKAGMKIDTVTIYFEYDPLTMTADYKVHDLVFLDDVIKTNILTLEFLGPPEIIGDKIQSLKFNIEDTDYPDITKKDLTLGLISHKEGSPSLSGNAKINIDISEPYIASLTSTIYAINWQNEKGDLRIPKEVPTGHIISNSKGDLSDDVTCLDSEDTACYFLQKTVLATTSFFVCKDIAIAGNLLLCSKSIAYEPANTAGFITDIVTVGSDGNIHVTASPIGESSNWEMVLSNGDPSAQKVCGDTFSNTENPVCIPQPTGNLEVLLVGLKADGSIIESSKTSVEELDVSAQALSTGSTVIEVNVQNKGNKLFLLSRDSANSASDPSYLEVDVDCHEIPETSTCRGYFVNLEAFTYTVTVNTRKGGGSKIKSPEYKTNTVAIIGGYRRNYQTIHVETTATNVTERNTEFDVCFDYVTIATTQGTHYEFLAINSKGMWKKILGERKKSESQACFLALDLLTADFNENSKFLVILRDTTNGNVLASGEAALDLNALRAIKPEVDNGSDGSTSTLAIVGAAIGGIACLMALVAAAVMFVKKINRDNDGLQYPLHRTNIEQDSSYIHGLDNPIPTM